VRFLFAPLVMWFTALLCRRSIFGGYAQSLILSSRLGA
jgi:hypothetical protein